MSIAAGKYLARMNSDDVYSLNHFEKEYNFLESNPEYVLVSCNVILFDNLGEYGIVKYTEN